MATQTAKTPIGEIVEEQAKQNRFFTLSLDMFFILGFDGSLKQVNPMCEKILALSTAELLAQPLLELVHPEDRQSTVAQLQKLATSEETVTFENRCRCGGGSYKWLLWNAAPCQDDRLIYAAARDITERKQAREALEQAYRELEVRVEERTFELKAANEMLVQEISDRQRTEVALRQSKARLKQQAQQLEDALHKLHSTQAQLIQTEKMSSLGQLVAGVAHEINNPVSFIYGNLDHASHYIHDLLHLIVLYRRHYSHPPMEIQNAAVAMDLDFVIEDMPKLLSSMKLGADRIRQIVLSLRNFARHDESEMKRVDIHEGLDSTIKLLQNRLKGKGEAGIQVIQGYGDLPPVECYAGLLNQVFMNLLNNAIDALENHPEPRIITICTELAMRDFVMTYSGATLQSEQSFVPHPYIIIRIVDNGPGMTEDVCRRLFDPFFTTKPIGKNKGLGLSISYQIVVEKHSGQLYCVSAPGEGTEFIIEIPVQQNAQWRSPDNILPENSAFLPSASRPGLFQ